MQPNENKVIMNSEQQTESKPTLSRRKFLVRAGAGSLPVVMSLQSGSAWGCIELNCTPGSTSLSNSGSKVASVTANKKKLPYQRPQWTNLTEIREAFTVDFDGYLLKTYNQTLSTMQYSRTDAKGKIYYKFNEVSKTNYNNWWNHVCVDGRVDGKKVDIYHNTPGSESLLSNCTLYNKHSTREPGNFNNVIVKSDTLCTDICSGINGTVHDVLYGRDCPERSVIAALIGSIWERHPEYKNAYTKPKCFPEPSVLVTAYTKAKTQGKLKDLHTLIKLYMSPLK